MDSTTGPSQQPTPSSSRGQVAAEDESHPTETPSTYVSTSGRNDRHQEDSTGRPSGEPVLRDKGRRSGQAGLFPELGGRSGTHGHPAGTGGGTSGRTQQPAPGAQSSNVEVDVLIRDGQQRFEAGELW